MCICGASQVVLVVKNLPAGDVRDVGLIPGSGRSPGEGNGKPLQYSCLENLMDRRAWWATGYRVTKSQTRLKRLSRHACMHMGVCVCVLNYTWVLGFDIKCVILWIMRAPMVVETLKNLPTMWETWVQSLSWEDSPGEGNGYPLHYSGLENSMDRGAWQAMGHKSLKNTILNTNLM